MTTVEKLSGTPAETTDLERRVLAHERILQALIAYIARSEPRFVDHLKERFVEPMKMSRHEHDYRETDDYAEEFMRAVILLGETRAPQPKPLDMPVEQPAPTQGEGGRKPSAEQMVQRDRVQMRERSGIWEVKLDGKFYGDFLQKEPAIAAAALLKLSLR
ncbi:hypothetical protein [Seohaeicola zhoushanensis]|nr:hypothetical protein [Seohaeicola zhoushanensis]